MPRIDIMAFPYKKTELNLKWPFTVTYGFYVFGVSGKATRD